MRTMLVAPGVPNGTPATMMTRWPALAKPGESRAAGAVRHVIRVARIRRDDGVDAPCQRETPRRVDVRRERKDRWLRTLARDAQARRARCRPRHDGLEIERL